MAYVKTTWKTGDKVTSTKLNKIEQGIYDNDAACDELKTALSVLEPTATSADVGKALIAKTVADGKVTEYEFGEAGGGGASAIVNSVENVPIASFDDGTETAVKQIVVGIEPVQSGSGDPSPDNVRPITGWTGAKIPKTGVNLFDKTNTFDGYINDANGQYTAQSNNKCTDYISVKGGQSYRIITDQTTGMWGAWYDIDKQYISGISGYTTTPVKTAPENAAYIRLTVVRLGDGNIDTFALNYPSTEMSYHSFTGALYEVTFPTEAGTVYGGTLTNLGSNVWKLTVNAIGKLIQDFSWTYNTQYARFLCSNLQNEIVHAQANNTRLQGLMSSCYTNRAAIATGTNPINNTIAVDTYGNILIRDTRVTTVNDFLNAVGNEIIAYPISTAIEYTITTTEIITLLAGYNNVWADTGNINLLQYYADSKKYIDEQDTLIKALIAPVLDGMVADTALTVNDFRIVYNTLYRITAPVAAGAALTPNTNCTATTISAILKTLLT